LIGSSLVRAERTGKNEARTEADTGLEAWDVQNQQAGNAVQADIVVVDDHVCKRVRRAH